MHALVCPRKMRAEKVMGQDVLKYHLVVCQCGMVS